MVGGATADARSGVAYAGLVVDVHGGHGMVPLSVALSLVGLGITVLPGGRRRRLLIAIVFMLVFAATQVGCGGSESNSQSVGACEALSTGQADYDLALGGDPNDPNIIFLGLVGLYKSSDGGGSWKYVISDVQGLHSDFHSATVNDGDVWVTNDGGVSLSTDGGTTWNTAVNNGLNTMQFQGVAISKTGSGNHWWHSGQRIDGLQWEAGLAKCDRWRWWYHRGSANRSRASSLPSSSLNKRKALNT